MKRKRKSEEEEEEVRRGGRGRRSEIGKASTRKIDNNKKIKIAIGVGAQVCNYPERLLCR